jgi:hypothetical protein
LLFESVLVQMLDIDGNFGLKSVNGAAIAFAGWWTATPHGHRSGSFATRRCAHSAAFCHKGVIDSATRSSWNARQLTYCQQFQWCAGSIRAF